MQRFPGSQTEVTSIKILCIRYGQGSQVDPKGEAAKEGRDCLVADGMPVNALVKTTEALSVTWVNTLGSL